MDANLNRAREGLRVLEDLARFILQDTALTQEFRRLRHGLLPSSALADRQLLAERDAAGDIAAQAEGARTRTSLPELALANARRVEESLRVLEEFAQLSSLPPGLSGFKEARFTLYTLEQRLFHRLLRRDKLERLNGLYVIVDTQLLRGRRAAEVALQAIRGGARVIQLRDKKHDHGELLAVARELREVCTREGVLFIVNDHLDMVLASDADGLHLGQTDLPLEVGRRFLPGDKILGGSTHSVEEALQAQAQGADYIGVGSILPTSTKDTVTLVGPEMISRVREKVNIPVVAIGGINKENIAQVLAVGPQAVAVISAVVGALDVEGAARELVATIKSFQKGA